MKKCKVKTLSLGYVWAYRLKLRAEGVKLRAEGDKLWAEGNKLWAEAVIAVHGNIMMEWKSSTHCVLGTGEEFTEAALVAGRGK